MYILSQDKKRIIDTREAAIFEYRGEIRACDSLCEGGYYVLGNYRIDARSNEVLKRIFEALKQGEQAFEMPEA